MAIFKKQQEEKNPNIAKLMTASGDMEADIIESLLRSYGIPSMKKRKGAGEYVSIITGMNTGDVDIFVPAHMLEHALEIINSPVEEIIEI